MGMKACITELRRGNHSQANDLLPKLPTAWHTIYGDVGPAGSGQTRSPSATAQPPQTRGATTAVKVP
eukprot:5523670-Amphidinium_carterae.1